MPDHARPTDTYRAPLTPERLRNILRLALDEHPAVADVRDANTIHLDRIAMNVIDRTGLTWRVWLAHDPWTTAGRPS